MSWGHAFCLGDKVVIARHACGHTWVQVGSRTAHCCACHRTFATETSFARHRSRFVCSDPKVMLTKDGQHLFVSTVDRMGEVIWLVNKPMSTDLRDRFRSMKGKSNDIQDTQGTELHGV